MQKKFTLSFGLLIAGAGLAAFALGNGPLKEVPEGGYPIPYEIQPTEAQWGECKVFDFNGDGTHWILDSTNGFKYSYNYSNPGDDWCVLPGMKMAPGNYKITYSYKTSYGTENFRIALGEVPADVLNAVIPPEEEGAEPAITQDEFAAYFSIPVLEKEDYKNPEWVTETTVVEIPAAGEYHLGLYSYSIANQYAIFIRNISIEKLDENQPLAPEIAITSVGLEGTAQITLPTKNYGGNDLSGTVSATLSFEGSSEPIVTVSGTPGETQSVDFVCENYNTYKLVGRAFIDYNDETLYSEPVVVEHRFSRVKPELLPLGYQIIPDADQAEWCEVVNADDNDRTWEFVTSGLPVDNKYPGAFRYSYAYSHGADDWLILPAYENTDPGAMRVQFMVGTQSNKEVLEIAVAYTDDIEALQENIVWRNEALQTDTRMINETAYFSTSPSDKFYVAFHCASPANRASVYVQDIVVSKANPMIPDPAVLSDAEFDGGDGTIQLTLPSTNLGGSDIEGTIYTDLILDGEPYGETITGTAGEVKVLEFSNLALGPHTLIATSYIYDGEEAVNAFPATFNFRVVMSTSFFYTLPLDLALDNQEVFDAFEVFDVNEDGSTWMYDNSTGAFKCKYDSNNEGDDWIISPGVQIDTNEYDLEISLNARCQSATYNERVEVRIGTERSPEGMTIQALPATLLTSDTFADYTNTFTVPEPGRYYIGIHYISDPDKFYLFVKGLKLKPAQGVGVKANAAGYSKVVGMNGAVRLQGMNGQEVTMMNMAGQVVKSGKVSSNIETIVAAPGIYVVKSGKETFKVVVK